MFERESIAGLHRTADAEVERQPHHVGAAVGGDTRGAVRGAVIDDDDVETGIERADLVDDAAHRPLLVQRRHDCDPFELRELIEDRHAAQYGYRPRPSSFRANTATPSEPLIRMRLRV